VTATSPRALFSTNEGSLNWLENGEKIKIEQIGGRVLYCVVLGVTGV
jgi:hypothetical protein